LLIGMATSGRSASLLLGVHGRCQRDVRLVKCSEKKTSYLRFLVDSKTQQLSLLPPAKAPRVSGGTKAERALMLRIARSIGIGSQTRIAIKKAGRSWHPYSSNAVVVAFSGKTLESGWQASLAAVLFQRSADVQVVARESSSGGVRIGRLPGDVSPPADVGSPISFQKELVLARRLISMVEGDGASVVSLTLARPAGLAVSATIQTGRPAAYLKHDLGAVLSILRRPSLAGSFVRVVDRQGKRVLETGLGGNEGSVSVLPALDGCSPIMHSERMGYSPKPCPAK
jgi:hypothetical protein